MAAVAVDHLDEAVRLKEAWIPENEHDHFLLSDWVSRTGLLPRELVRQQTASIAEQPVFATDVRASGRFAALKPEQRVLRSTVDLKKDAELLLAFARLQPSLLPEHLGIDGVERVLSRVFEQLGERRVYTRPGLLGLRDLLTDRFLLEWHRSTERGRMFELLPWAATQVESIDWNAGADRLEVGRSEIVGLIDGLAGPAAEAAQAGAKLRVVDPTRISDAPRTLRSLLRHWPQVGRYVESLQASGFQVGYYQLDKFPPRVMEAIREIAAGAQHTYVRDWLSKLVLHSEGADIRTSPPQLEHASQLVHDGKLQVTPERLAEDVQILLSWRRAPAGFVVSGGERPEEADAASDFLNSVLREFSADLMEKDARSLMILQNANETTEKAQGTIWKASIAAPFIHLLEQAHLGYFDFLPKLLALMVDDGLYGFAEYQVIQEQMGQKVSRRWKLGAIPVFGEVVAASMAVNPLLHSGHSALAGAFFGVAAVSLTGYFAAMSLQMRYRLARALASDGKVDGHDLYPLLANEEFQRELKQLKSKGVPTPAQLVSSIGRTVDLEALDDDASTRVETVRAQLEDPGLTAAEHEALIERMSLPSRGRLFATALKQDFTNPARIGLAVGLVLAVIAGIGAASAGLMDFGPAEVGIGMMETIGTLGALTSASARRKAASLYRWSRHVARSTRQGLQSRLLPPDWEDREPDVSRWFARPTGVSAAGPA